MTRSTAAERFTLDTNVLVYAADNLAGEKQHRALDLIARAARSNCHLTLQALSEFYAVVTQKDLVPRPEATAQMRDWIDLFPTLPPTPAALPAAAKAAEGGRIAYWDALLLATAHDGGCTVVLSENMRDGAKLLGVRIRNPFAGVALPAAVERLLG